ncbi:flavin mononucleotide-binding protein [Bizionia gelidisalsuginis]|uniref:Flavin mononucleotide-binding protein n=2 Tax=Bizionia TaxID=283785 RepID=A0A8H2LFA4_9FLAO|nr:MULTISPECIES: pyridoxamine 5'-phosphate oxidase family protein [Bizionia]TYB71515.1 flavin mononucleotide-binding protein [Bizionia saleffrena]TYC10765.1 flavin mononucleotide-binding protein [Bizionia gelidisalsuginis]
MRRPLKDTENLRLLADNYIGNLAYISQNKPFVVPITYFYNKEKNAIIGYSAMGHKIRGMRENRDVSLLVTDVNSVSSWKSILVHGTYEELSNSEAKAQMHTFSLGVKHLVVNNEFRTVDFIEEFSSKIDTADYPIVFLINIDEVTGRIRTE